MPAPCEECENLGSLNTTCLVGGWLDACSVSDGTGLGALETVGVLSESVILGCRGAVRKDGKISDKSDVLESCAGNSGGDCLAFLPILASVLTSAEVKAGCEEKLVKDAAAEGEASTLGGVICEE